MNFRVVEVRQNTGMQIQMYLAISNHAIFVYSSLKNL